MLANPNILVKGPILKISISEMANYQTVQSKFKLSFFHYQIKCYKHCANKCQLMDLCPNLTNVCSGRIQKFKLPSTKLEKSWKSSYPVQSTSYDVTD